MDRNGWFLQGRNILSKYDFSVIRSKQFGFNCLNYRVPPKIGLFQAEIVMSLIPNFSFALAPLVNMSTFFPPDKFKFEIIIPIKSYHIL